MTVVLFPIVIPIIQYLAEKVKDKVTDEALSTALGMIIKTNQEQLAKLGQIDQKLSALLQGPFNTGMNYLEQASLPHRTASDQREYLRRALDEFNRALGNETGNLERSAWIRWHIALCHALLHEDQDAQYHFEKCSEEANQSLGLMRSAYESEAEKHDKSMERLNRTADGLPVAISVTGLALAALFIFFGAPSLLANFTSGNALILLAVGLVVIGLIRSLVRTRKPKPLEERVSPIMASLLKSVEQVRASAKFDSALQTGG